YGRDDVYIANIVKCRPPGNRNPQDAEADKCLPYLERQIELVDPKVIVLLGAVPLNYLLNMKGIMRSHGKWMSYKGIDVMPSFHPAFLLRKPEHKRDAWEDMQKVMEKLGKPSA
ncbi:MAG: uracil-DNA glycosylase, partial [Lentisphaeria bacterium]|nr:uracil-DNA glycosylase [Lentisphaeria bacterium]NQZ70756.1 uracil-DNA glycosylase [Lentisphaeria bacterium]